MRTLLFIIGFCFSGLYTAAQVSDQSLIESGRHAYAEGNFPAALEHFRALDDKGYHSFELYYNIGNTYFKLNNIPSAILYYERAKRLNPHDEDLLFNLELANSKIADEVEALNQGQFWENFLRQLAVDSWAILSIAFFFLFLLTLFLFIYLRQAASKRLFMGMSAICLFLSFIMFFMAWQSRKELYDRNYGIVFDPSITVTSAPGDAGNKLFVIHEGLKVELLQHTGPYSKIKLPNGHIGWIPAESIERI